MTDTSDEIARKIGEAAEGLPYSADECVELLQELGSSGDPKAALLALPFIWEAESILAGEKAVTRSASLNKILCRKLWPNCGTPPRVRAAALSGVQAIFSRLSPEEVPSFDE